VFSMSFCWKEYSQVSWRQIKSGVSFDMTCSR
jgi:hypothetical protein